MGKRAHYQGQMSHAEEMIPFLESLQSMAQHSQHELEHTQRQLLELRDQQKRFQERAGVLRNLRSMPEGERCGATEQALDDGIRAARGQASRVEAEIRDQRLEEALESWPSVVQAQVSRALKRALSTLRRRVADSRSEMAAVES